MTITEKVAYLKGLIEGMKIDLESDNGKVLKAVVDLLDDLALEITDQTQRLDEIDADLADVEDLVYGDFEDYDEDDDEAGDDDVYSFECPNCHETVYFDDSIFEDDDEDFELECPSCGAKLDSIFEMDDEDEDDE